MPPTVIAGPYLSDLLAQPETLRAVHQGLLRQPALTALAERLREGLYRRVVLTGMGSSYHALYPLHLSLSAQGWTSHWIETSELLLGHHPLRAPDTLLVVVSQSGESAEIVGLTKHVRAFGHVISVTNSPSSALGRVSSTLLPLHAGEETTVSCKTYVASLATLHWLAAALTGGCTAAATADLAAAVPRVRDYLEDADGHVTSLLEWVEGIDCVFVAGRGGSLATAGTGGLILKESTCRPAEGMSCAAFRHGPFEMVGPRVLVVVLAGEPQVETLNRRLVTDIERCGGRAALVATARVSSPAWQVPIVPAPLLPLVEILPIQMLSLAIAARDGREAGRFERATKITTAE